MEQIYQWFEYRKKTCWSFSFILQNCRLIKTIGWKEQEPEAELSVKVMVLDFGE